MLVFSQKVEDAFEIDVNGVICTVIVGEVRGNRARLIVDVPREYKVTRISAEQRMGAARAKAPTALQVPCSATQRLSLGRPGPLTPQAAGTGLPAR